MSRHLSEEALLAMVERPGAEASGSHAQHLASCERCRQLVETARHALAASQSTAIPEPSPLFWDHFSANVRDRIRTAEEGNAVRRAPLLSAIRLAAAACVLIFLALIAFWRLGPQSVTPAAPETKQANKAAVPYIAPQAAEPSEQTAADAEWQLVADASTGVDLQSATEEAFSLQPGSAERAATQLSAEEQHELIRLLQAEAAGAGPSVQ